MKEWKQKIVTRNHYKQIILAVIVICLLPLFPICVEIWDNPALQSLNGLEACTELKILNGYNSSIGNIEELSNCTKLETINLYNKNV